MPNTKKIGHEHPVFYTKEFLIFREQLYFGDDPWNFGLPGVSVVSLDKSLEVKRISARVGDNLEVKCDVTGTPTPPIVWRRHGLDLAALNSEVIS